MARGGYRPNAGRPKLTEAEKAERRAAKAAGLLPAAKKSAPAKKAPAKKVPAKKAAKRTSDRVVHKKQPEPLVDEVPADIVDEAKLADMSPLDYMLKVMRTPAAEAARRDRMAIAAAPFVHARKEASAGPGKRQTVAEAGQTAAGGRFAPKAPPKLVVNN